MKKKILGSVAILAIAMAVAFNVNLNRSKTNQTSLLTLANVEALAEYENNYPDYKDCPILEYNRGFMEAWEQEEWFGTIGATGTVTIGGYTFGPFGVGMFVRFPYQKGICTYAPNNCCVKSHVGRATPL